MTIFDKFDNWLSKNEKRNTFIFTTISALITVFLIGNIAYLLSSFSQMYIYYALKYFFCSARSLFCNCTAAGVMASVDFLLSKE